MKTLRDGHGDPLELEAAHLLTREGPAVVFISSPGGEIHFPREDAPAVALALLEEAMTDESSHADPVALQNARAWLRTYLNDQEQS